MPSSPKVPANIPELEVECWGGPRDGQRLTLHNLEPVIVDGELAGYMAEDEPRPTEEGAYVVSPCLRLEWVLRIQESDDRATDFW